MKKCIVVTDGPSREASKNFYSGLDKLENDIGITFQDRSLLETALTHRSYRNEDKSCVSHWERLEYLGDAVLELIVREHLLLKLPEATEGELTKVCILLVQGKTIGALAEQLRFPELIRMSRGLVQNGFKDQSKVWADAFEALVGAIYLDQGLKVAGRFVEQTVLRELSYLLEEGLDQDPISTLQEITQAKYGIAPRYEVLSEGGPDHQKEYVVGIYLGGSFIEEGTGASKKEARMNAAQNALAEQKKWVNTVASIASSLGSE